METLFPVACAVRGAAGCLPRPAFRRLAEVLQALLSPNAVSTSKQGALDGNEASAECFSP